MKIKVNENFADVKESYLFSDIAKRAREYAEKHPDKKIIKLGIGDVTLPLGDSVVKALKSASDEMGVKETFRGYPPEYGYDFLKEAIVKHYKNNGVEISADSVFVSDGAKSDCGNIVDILGNNEILIPSPVYPVYMDSNIMSGRKITLFEGNRENGFLPMPDCLGKGKEGCVVYLCSPNNPTGAVYSENQLEKWVNWANDTGSLIIFDSAYECFINGDYPHSIFKVPGAESCAIEICSFSKMAGFTGTRCGWTVIPESLSAGEFSLN
ncbi:MAG: aminotransferase class I/II-fold pyridoxal phosphate-dependent enzyme, partial [Acutalibacteraceae bacterium]